MENGKTLELLSSIAWKFELFSVFAPQYNKPGTLPYIDMGLGGASVAAGGYEKMIENLESARNKGFEQVDPLAAEFKGLAFKRGVHASKNDYVDAFVTEKVRAFINYETCPTCLF